MCLNQNHKFIIKLLSPLPDKRYSKKLVIVAIIKGEIQLEVKEMFKQNFTKVEIVQ